MSGFLLDTNVPSELIRLRPEPRVQAWVAEQVLNEMFLSVVSFGEFRKGIALRSPGRRRTELETWLETDIAFLFSGRILPVTRSIAERWGKLEARREQIGWPLHVPDGQIAATALEHDLTLVTRNVRDFGNLGVSIFNPWDSLRGWNAPVGWRNQGPGIDGGGMWWGKRKPFLIRWRLVETGW